MLRIIAVLAGLTLLTGAAGAQEPPHRVVNVSLDDVLNVRLSPSANAPIVGAIPPTGAGIEVLSRPNDDWTEIRYRRMRGFVATRYIAAVPFDMSKGLPPVLACTGTEPFWSLRFSEGTYRFEQMDGPGAEGETGEPRMSRNSIVVHSVQAGAQLAVIEEDRFCSDAMSDTAYTHAITLIGPQDTLSGCCRVPVEGAGAAP